MVSAKVKRKFTYEDYCNAPDDKRYELLDGELVVAPAPNIGHQSISRALMWKFINALMHLSKLGEVFAAPTDVVFTDTDVVQPDVIFVSNERVHIITEANIQGAPDLVVEILSPSTAVIDRTFKRALYERHGVGEYWMVDPDARNVTVLILGGEGYELAATYGEGQTLRSPTIPDFRLDMDEVFAG